jgi:hypothetical protein
LLKESASGLRLWCKTLVCCTCSQLGCGAVVERRP